jgi:hypothetical protein
LDIGSAFVDEYPAEGWVIPISKDIIGNNNGCCDELVRYRGDVA